MTRNELLSSIRKRGHVVLSAPDFCSLFPGHALGATEFEFREEVRRAGGPYFLDHGVSQSDTLLTFCQKHNLSMRWGKEKVLFHLGNIIDESVVQRMDSDESTAVKEVLKKGNQELRNQSVDYVASAVKSIIGTVPFAGSLLVEIAGTIIPNQRIDRIANLAAILDAKLAVLDQEFVRSKLVDENFTDLMEEGLRQASRSLSNERREYIASLLANSITAEKINFAESKHLLRILGDINDVQVIMLGSRHYSSTEEYRAYQQKHAKVLSPWTEDAIGIRVRFMTAMNRN